MRVFKLITVSVLAGCAGLAAGCSASGSARPAHTASGQQAAPRTAASAPQLTVAGARQAFDAFLPQFNEMVASGNVTMAGKLTTGPEAAVSGAEMSMAGSADAVSLQPLTRETFYVPRTQSYPRWFAVTAKARSGAGLVMLMLQTAPGAPWREAERFTDLPATGTGSLLPALPGVSRTPQGFAMAIAQDTTAVPGFRQDLTMTPGQVPADYAATLNGARTGFVAGAMTSELVAANRQSDARAAASGWLVRQSYQSSGYPVYTLRTNDGCTLTFFSVMETQTWTPSGAGASAMPMTRRYLLEELAIQPIRGDDDETGVKMIPAQGGGPVA